MGLEPAEKGRVLIPLSPVAPTCITCCCREFMGFISWLFSRLCLKGTGYGYRSLHSNISLSSVKSSGQHELALKPQISPQPVRPSRYVTYSGNSNQNKNQGCVWREGKSIEKQKKSLEQRIIERSKRRHALANKFSALFKPKRQKPSCLLLWW